jgi:hypothetical protein
MATRVKVLNQTQHEPHGVQSWYLADELGGSAIPPIHAPTAFAAAPLDAVSQLPEVEADGKGTKMGSHTCAGDHAGHSSVLRKLSACAVHYFDLAQQRNRGRQPVLVDRQRQ